ncbi:MAG: hypothetical protein Mars2KO_19310 [Maribacter sp.]
MSFIVVISVGVLGIAYNLNLYLKNRKNFNAALRVVALVVVLSFYIYNEYFE